MTAWIKVSVILLVFIIIIPITSFVGEFRRKSEKATLIEKMVNGSPEEKKDSR